jgi:Mg/Co/Ni transporter MgtE
MRYATARYNQNQREEVYRIYVTDSLKHLAGLNIRYADVFKPEETRTAEEIIDGIKGKLRQLGGE